MSNPTTCRREETRVATYRILFHRHPTRHLRSALTIRHVASAKKTRNSFSATFATGYNAGTARATPSWCFRGHCRSIEGTRKRMRYEE
ncbi:hypothetical protein C8R42DRAFT_293169 [Lentinula raphanica]|nr:hypothetical protein C8R42DRAFT_293169 [Lentinula raphanica]